MTKKVNVKFGTILWLSACMFGSIVYGIIFTRWFNSLENFDELNFLELIFVIFILFIFSNVLSAPYLFYLLIREQMKIQNRLKIKEYNLIFTFYSLLLYFIFSKVMVSYFESLQLLATYFVTGIIALNLYIKKKIIQ